MNASVLKVTGAGEYSAGIIVDEQLYTYDVQCSITEHVLPRQTEQTSLNTLTEPTHSLGTLSRTLGIQSQVFSTWPQTFSTWPQTFSTQPQTSTTQPQTFTTLPQTFTTQPQSFSTQPQAFTKQPQTFNTQSKIFTMQSQTYITQPQTNSSLPQTIISQQQANSYQPHAKSSKPQTVSHQQQTDSSQPQTDISQPMTISSQSHSYTQSQTKTSLQQTNAQPAQTFGTLSCTVPRINLADVNLGKEIGRGGFGIVYQGSWIGTKVAIKEIKIKRMKIAKPLVDRELCVHSQLRHPNIVMLMAFALENDRLYLVSELIDDVTLDNCLFGTDGTYMNMSVKLNVSLKISQAIAYLHAQNPMIIHRDIKPENILVANNLDVVKLCDMGISKLNTMNTVMTTMAGVSIQPGTPVYQAPEILLDKRSANEMTDIWSLACTLVKVFNEMPIWNSSDEPVQYIMNRMKLQAKPDGLELLAALADTLNENVESKIYYILDKGLNYSDGVRPHALQIVNYLHCLLGDS